MRRVGTCAGVAALGVLSLVVVTAAHEGEPFSPPDVRRAALAAGLGALGSVKVPTPDNLGAILNRGAGARRAAVQLGKALFWDMQVGSDGQACASCHFHAGADSRTKNQLSPGPVSGARSGRAAFEPTASGGGGPNTMLTADDFPFHQLEDRQDRASLVLHDTDDVCSSQGVFRARFVGIAPGQSVDRGRPVPDPTFNVGGKNVRQVARRNAPSVINAVFNVVNFWDGRAHHLFNGVSSAGPLDERATILVSKGGTLLRRVVRIRHASLASQAVGPPGNDLEMAFFDRPFRDLGRKLLSLRPLGRQLVHPDDSILGPLSRARLDGKRVKGKPGLSDSYADLIQRAFQGRFWDSDERADGYTLMENNFSLFFGLAVQLYESTLVSDRTPFDRFMEGDDIPLCDEQLRGLLTFLNRGGSEDPVFLDISQGNCVGCHSGPAFTAAAATGPDDRLIEIAERSALAVDDLHPDDEAGFVDRGFSNIGVRPTGEDLGRGGLERGFPLSFVRQHLLGLVFAPAFHPCGGADETACPPADRVLVDGAFKVPGLRNVDLTGPYFHNGGQATLEQVIAFYERRGDFSDQNLRDLHPDLARVDFIEDDAQPLLLFLRSLTDPRVRTEEAPFDHPQLFVPNGHPGDEDDLACVRGLQACDALLEIPAVGEAGRNAAGLDPLATFLGL